MTFQFNHLLKTWFTRRDETEWVLGAIYKTEGPCYRKAGAMMFFSGNGEHLGLLSGGCLEADIHQHARRVMQSGIAKTLCYDGSDEDDISFQLGIGCGGKVFLALFPITSENNYLHLIDVHSALDERKTCELQLKIPTESHEPISCYTLHGDDRGADTSFSRSTANFFDEGEDQWLTVDLVAEPHLLVVGGGVDARPLVALARELGWEVTLWDSRPANARREYFMSASRILECSVEQLGEYAQRRKVNAAIIMTHNVTLDAVSLQTLANTSLAYLGLLGPESRKSEVITVAKLVDKQIQSKISGPAGFELGGEIPEAIALSILSECHARVYGIDDTSVIRSKRSVANVL